MKKPYPKPLSSMELLIKRKNKTYKVIIDNEDFDWIKKFTWHIRKDRHTFYAEAWWKGHNRKIQMHRLIMRTPDDMLTDHINGNGLDNRKSNLRVCNRWQNAVNRKTNPPSGIKGVHYRPDRKKWRAMIHFDNKVISLGHFDSKEDAGRAFKEAAKKYHGQYANV